jgi:hypothetical protein
MTYFRTDYQGLEKQARDVQKNTPDQFILVLKNIKT